MDTVQFSLIGVDALLNKIKSVSHEIGYKGGRTGLRKAANFVADNARARAEQMDDAETGRKIANNFAVLWSSRRFKSTGDLMFRIGVRHGAVIREKGNPDSGSNGPTPHWRFKEFGTENLPAESFMRPALANNINEATNIFITECEKAIDRAVKRASK